MKSRTVTDGRTDTRWVRKKIDETTPGTLLGDGSSLVLKGYWKWNLWESSRLK